LNHQLHHPHKHPDNQAPPQRMTRRATISRTDDGSAHSWLWRIAGAIMLGPLALAGAMAVIQPAAAVASGQTYVTIMFSRAQVEGVTAPNCTPMPNSVPIWQVAQDLA